MRRTLAFYIRLSISDADVAGSEKEESNSITSQRKLLYAYIHSHEEFAEYEVLEYFDDGVSGTGFENRTQFQAMLADAQAGKFECLLVKDFSRFGRDYLEVGNYMEFVFPVMGIRFISVNDGYDSKQQNGMTGGMDVAFRNLIYQMYSRDLSRKVKSARKNRNEQGEYTASFAPFGYRKNPSDKHKLVVDEPAAEVVREIFALAAGGKSAAEIARILNGRKTPTRLQRQWEREIHYKPTHNMGDYLWENTTVLVVIRNPIYKGTLIQNRYETVGFGDNKKLAKRDKSEWSIVENQVPAIVSGELFDKVNSLFSGYTGNRQKPKSVNLFYCPYCGRKLRKTRHKPKYVCGIRNANPDLPCAKIFMEKEEAEQMVLETVREACRMRLDALMVQRQADDNKKKTSVCLLAELEKEKQRVEDNTIQLYKEYASGGYSKEEYLALSESNQSLLGELEEKISGLIEQGNEPEPEENEDDLKQCSMLEEYDGNVLSKLIDRVYIYGDGNLQVVFKNDDYFQKVCMEGIGRRNKGVVSRLDG